MHPARKVGCEVEPFQSYSNELKRHAGYSTLLEEMRCLRTQPSKPGGASVAAEEAAAESGRCTAAGAADTAGWSVLRAAANHGELSCGLVACSIITAATRPISGRGCRRTAGLSAVE